MKSLHTVLFALIAAAGLAHAGSAKDDLARKLAREAASTPATSLASLGAVTPFRVVAPAGGACDTGTPDIVIHDDGEAENGYGWNAIANVGRQGDKFTPVVYPATVGTVCMAFITNAGVTSFNFDIAVYADDGTGGAPGTELGRQTFVGHPTSISGVPVTPVYEAFDISGMGINLVSGSVYIATEWNAAVEPGGVFIAADQSTTTPLNGGYMRANADPWAPIVDTRPDYRALFIRATMPPAGPGAPSLSKAFAPTQVLANTPSTLTITLRNNSQPTAAVLSADLVDTLPTGLVVAATPNAATTCTGTLTANAGAGTITLASGAEIPASNSCTITVDVTGAADGTYLNTIPAGALQTQHGNNAMAANATLKVGYTFPEPYPNVSFPSSVEPITNVNFAGIDNTTSATVGGTPALEDFTAISGNVAPGGTFHISVQGNTAGAFTTKVNVFFDWDQSGSFDAGEEVQIGDLIDSTGTDGKTVETDIVVPMGAVTGSTRMRVMKKWNSYATPNNTTGYGQAEDYTLNVAPASNAPTVAKAFAPAQVWAGDPSTLTITLNNASNAVDAILTADLVDTFPTNVVVADTPNASTTCGSGTVTAVAGSGSVTLASGASIPASGSCTISVDVESAVNGTYTNTIAAGALQTDQGNSPFAANANLKIGFTFPEPYCAFNVTSNVEPITHVLFAGIDNTTSATVNATPALENFTTIIGSVAQGDTVPMALEGNSDGSFTNHFMVYVDWNQDGDFSDADESYPAGSITASTGTDGQQALSSIAVPGTALNGPTRMRVTKNYNTPTASACGSVAFGQAEDYTLLVGPPTPSVAKAFSPGTVLVNQDSTLTITLTNPTAANATLTAPLVDNLPAGLTVSAASTSCGLIIGGGGMSPSASTITLPAGVVLPAGGSCTITATVQSATPGSYVNTIPAGALQTDQGNNALAASATLTVNPMPPPLATFTPGSFSFTVQSDQTTSGTLNIANAAGRDVLSYSIDAREVLRPVARASGLSKRASAPRVNLQPVTLAGSGRSGGSAFAQPLYNPLASYTFQLDDGTYENSVGLGSSSAGTESGAVWINRFNATEALTIDSISIMWPTNSGGTVVGLQANLVVYYDADADGDPTNAQRIGTDQLVTIAALDVFETYTTSFVVPGAGDVYVGFVDQWALAGGYTPRLFPAALDEDASQGMSHVSGAGTPPTNIDDLSANDLNGTIDSFGLAGNWLIRATGTSGAPTTCTGAVVGWMSASPASGTVNSGANTDVTITVDPSAGGLVPGSYSAELCITSNDPTQPLVAIPVSVTVTSPPVPFCNGGADEVFCDGFESAAGGDIVSGTINQPLVQDGDGNTFDFVTGQFGVYDAGRVDDINIYDFGSGMYVYWYGDMAALAVGGVVDSGGTEFAVLHSGDTIGPGSTISAASLAMTNWLGGTDGYIGIAFENEDTGQLNYGYIRMTTTASSGYPAQWLEYAYDRTGAAITIP